jgi:hypothetical protein
VHQFEFTFFSLVFLGCGCLFLCVVRWVFCVGCVFVVFWFFWAVAL